MYDIFVVVKIMSLLVHFCWNEVSRKMLPVTECHNYNPTVLLTVGSVGLRQGPWGTIIQFLLFEDLFQI